MPLQNRVDPFGDVHAVPFRGLFTGNRGVIHDPETKTLLERRWTTKAWIICECAFKGRHREVMGRNTPSGAAGWTELFFLDEVTALGAGHRPCFECRREKAKEFADCFGKAFGIARPKAGEIDERLHAERLASGGGLADLKQKDIDDLPDGAMLFQGERCFAKKGKDLRAWNFWGYANSWDYYDLVLYDIWRLTPPTTIAILRAGYQPVWHPSA
ncbi:hypothetical protein KEU06_07280 [Pseudaminobacter sp. 19-2017]|uniref:Uncharacterized protein n=1 Tax=Pseudaminobacter soli (ex Zhang et al. 2022) TaxID=2831468 RepID=A0A942E077_9HYPH|nr:hypothetical protein [Pseudaminobacter soli]MBS3648430.1 hypothetical protein [Pseudaminobacter soli]